MTVLEAVQLLAASGLFAGGIGILKWGVTVEKRFAVIEAKLRIHYGQS